MSRTAELRRAFDHAFAVPLHVDRPQVQDLLAIGVRDDAYGVHLGEIRGLFSDVTVTPLPSPLPDLLGIAGFRGLTIPVYDLGAVLGYSAGAPPRWLVLAAGDAVVGLAFDRFDGHLRLDRDALTADDGSGVPLRHVQEVARTPEGSRPVIRLSSVIEAIKTRARRSDREKER